MTTLTNIGESTLELDREQLAKLIQCPVNAAKGRLLSAAFRDLSAGPGREEAARHCRFAAFILENLSWQDAADYRNERDQYTSWFFGERKHMIRTFTAEADRLVPVAA